MSITLQDQLPAFLEYLQFEKRYSRNTVVSYETDLTQLKDYLVMTMDNLGLEEVSTLILRSWLAGMKDAGMDTRSINRKISAVKSFYRFLLRKELIQRNPAALLRLMKTSKRLPAFLDEADTGALMQEGRGEEGWKGYTRQIILEILYSCGLRVSELISLREKHVDTGLRQIKVLGKGNKERVIPMKPELAQQLGQYMEEKRKQIERPDTDYLLVNEKGQKLYARYIYREVNEELMAFRNVTKKSPHLMRHTFATQLANNGADLNAIKSLLGHSSLAATQVYTHNTIDKLKDIHKKAHPKA
ncbi:MAG: tyrosine-type recombinase/integrase [Chitinophagaceae bacterium]